MCNTQWSGTRAAVFIEIASHGDFHISEKTGSVLRCQAAVMSSDISQANADRNSSAPLAL